MNLDFAAMSNGSWVMVLSAVLFAIGAGGVLLRRNGIAVVIGLAVMFNAVFLALAAVGRRFAVTAEPLAAASRTTHVFALIVGAVAAAVIGVGLAMIISLRRITASDDVDVVNTLRW